MTIFLTNNEANIKGLFYYLIQGTSNGLFLNLTLGDMFIKLLAIPICQFHLQVPKSLRQSPKSPLTGPNNGKLWITDHCEIVPHLKSAT